MPVLSKIVSTFQGVVTLAVILGILAVIGFSWFKVHQANKELADLRNQVADKDKTIEEQKNTYTKLVREDSDLRSSNAELQKLLDKSHQDVIAAQDLAVYWKGKYVYAMDHKPVPKPPGSPPGPSNGGFNPPAHQEACTADPLLYTSAKDVGLLKITVDTFTVDPSYQQTLTLEPGSKPLELTLAVTRDKNKQWHFHAVSSDERIGVEVKHASVNMEPLATRWYERIKLTGDVGAGKNLMFGLGPTVQFNQWDVGARLWQVGPDRYYGGSFSWAPFKKTE